MKNLITLLVVCVFGISSSYKAQPNALSEESGNGYFMLWGNEKVPFIMLGKDPYRENPADFNYVDLKGKSRYMKYKKIKYLIVGQDTSFFSDKMGGCKLRIVAFNKDYILVESYDYVKMKLRGGYLFERKSGFKSTSTNPVKKVSLDDVDKKGGKKILQ